MKIKRVYNVPRMWQSYKIYDCEIKNFADALEVLFSLVVLAKTNRVVNEKFDRLIYGK